jgi:hypothetical protein
MYEENIPKLESTGFWYKLPVNGQKGAKDVF